MNSLWILSRYNLYNRKITLPNGKKVGYGQYKVPCCEDCNLKLGRKYEAPLSRLLKKSYDEIINKIEESPKILHTLFRWLCLIYFKTHYKDRVYKYELDERAEDPSLISDNYFWEHLHHLHCISRSHYTKAIIDRKVYGSVFIYPVDKEENFDYCDCLEGRSILLQLQDFAIIAVLNDSHAVSSVIQNLNINSHLKFPLEGIQLREIFAHINFININLVHRPQYYSYLNKSNEYRIEVSQLPNKVDLLEEEKQSTSLGELVKYFTEPMIGDVLNRNEMLKALEKGKVTFTFMDKAGSIKEEE
jgi:hypothetical protein